MCCIYNIIIICEKDSADPLGRLLLPYQSHRIRNVAAGHARVYYSWFLPGGLLQREKLQAVCMYQQLYLAIIMMICTRIPSTRGPTHNIYIIIFLNIIADHAHPATYYNNNNI